MSYINDRLLKQLVKLDGGESEEGRSLESDHSRYKITVGAFVQMIIRSRTLKLSNDNLKVFNWILDNFVNTTVKNDVLVIMKRIMDSLRSRLTDVNDLWSRFPSIPIVLYMMEQRYEVQFDCPKPGIHIKSDDINIEFLKTGKILLI